MASESISFSLESENNQQLANLSGQFDEHLTQIERRLGVEINHRGPRFNVIGSDVSVLATKRIIDDLYRCAADEQLTPAKIHLFLQESGVDDVLKEKDKTDAITIKTKRGVVRSRGTHQNEYLHSIQSHDLTFGIGPAGTGKTYLAVASAVEALETERVRRIMLVRPAVEAGERLGFLPGDLAQKIDPYLRPMYDALYEMLGFEKVHKLLERNVIEIAPLAYMRGRTLNESFVILDEAQNTTAEQMKMFLTRIGFGSTAVVTGDVTQIDLPRGQASGLNEVIKILHQIDGISFNFFTARDVVRHPLVKKIVEAYDRN